MKQLIVITLVIISPVAFAQLPEKVLSDGTVLPALTKAEVGLMVSFVSLSVVDAYQTSHAPPGFEEGNPLIRSWAGRHPSFAETMLFKSAFGYVGYRVGRRIKKRKHRRLALIAMNILEASVVAHNHGLTNGR